MYNFPYLVSDPHTTCPVDDTRYHCTYCGCDITLRLKCAVCPEFDLCLEVLNVKLTVVVV